MFLNEEQQAILNGSQGETMAKIMKTMVMFGDAFGAEKMVPVTSKHNHLVTSFGLKVMSPVYDLMQQLLDAGVKSGQTFSVDPRPIDKNVPANFLQNLVFNKLMYTKQDFYEGQLKKLGLLTYRWEESTQGPPRKYYMITDFGREQLAGLDAAWDELAQGIDIIRNGSKA